MCGRKVQIDRQIDLSSRASLQDSPFGQLADKAGVSNRGDVKAATRQSNDLKVVQTPESSPVNVFYQSINFARAFA